MDQRRCAIRIDVTYGFRCTASGCPETDVDHHDHVPATHLPQPQLPKGWQVFGLLVFCPKHTLMLQVDGQAQAVQTDPYDQ